MEERVYGMGIIDLLDTVSSYSSNALTFIDFLRDEIVKIKHFDISIGCAHALLLMSCLVPHDIVSAQGLS